MKESPLEITVHLAQFDVENAITSVDGDEVILVTATPDDRCKFILSFFNKKTLVELIDKLNEALYEKYGEYSQ